ncbi:MAG: hypothetical protein IJW17_06735 [Lentisphaeria bacterium]|nr:hypothetical protein [Lentisphaeria bacterium]
MSMEKRVYEKSFEGKYKNCFEMSAFLRYFCRGILSVGVWMHCDRFGKCKSGVNEYFLGSPFALFPCFILFSAFPQSKKTLEMGWLCCFVLFADALPYSRLPLVYGGAI